MNGTSLHITQDLIQKLKEVVPQAFTEDKLDIQQLKTLLGEDTFAQERYGLSWAGKAEAYKVLQQATTATLLPSPDQSIDWDNAENIFIEGENLEVLKVLQKAYYGKIKMIYIDPPYNTGNDSFIYPDKFSETKEEYLRRIGEKDDDGYMMKEGFFRKNSKENGQYHSNWLNMMLPRLFLARNLLKEDGVIFVSIDDNEQANLKLLMDEIFGEENFVADIIWEKRYGRSNDAKMFSSVIEHLMMYRKTDNISHLREGRTENNNSDYSNPDNDPRGVWTSVSFVSQRTKEERKNLAYQLKNPNTGEIFEHPTNSWKYNKEKYEELLKDNRFWWGKDGEQKFPRIKRFLSELPEGLVPVNLWKHTDTGTTDQGTKEVTELLEKNIFTFPKPTLLIKRMLKLSTDNDSNDIILDFFVGSGTTAQAVLELNEEDGGNRKYICVQLPEKTDETSEAYKAGYRTIADITKARIEKVVEKIKIQREKKRNESPIFNPENQENPKNQGSDGGALGFRKYTLASSNFKIWRSDFIENEEDLKRQMELFITPEKESSTTENILWELLIKNGVPLTEPIEKRVLETGEVIYYAKKGAMAFVLDKYTQDVQSKVLEIKPKSVICLDSLFEKNDNVKTNAQLKFEDNGVSFKTI